MTVQHTTANTTGSQTRKIRKGTTQMGTDASIFLRADHKRVNDDRFEDFQKRRSTDKK